MDTSLAGDIDADHLGKIDQRSAVLGGRGWQVGDVVTLLLPMRSRLVPIDTWHPVRVAILHRLMMMAQDAR